MRTAAFQRGCAAQVVLVALPGVDLAAVEAEVSAQCDALPRGDVARQALAHSCIVVAADQVRRAHIPFVASCHNL